MSHYSIGDACELLGVRPHVLRYWEQEVPLLAPRKSRSGRRVYSEADLHLLFRVRFLVQEKGYTLSGAGQRLMEDAVAGARDYAGIIREIRRELLAVEGILSRQRDSLNNGPARDAHIRK